MAIDKMKKVTLLCPVTATQRLMKKLHEMSVMEVVDVFDRYEDAREKLTRQEVSTEDCDLELQRLNLIIGLMDLFAPEKKSFVQGLAPVPLLVDPQELSRIKTQFPLDAQYAAAEDMDTEYRRIERAIGDTENRLKDLRPFESVPFPVDALRKIQSAKVVFGSISRQGLEALVRDAALPALAAVEEVVPIRPAGDNDNQKKSGGASARENVWILVACRPEVGEALRGVLDAHGFAEITLPQISGTVHEMIRSLEGDLDELQSRVKGIVARVEKLVEHRKEFLMLKAFWEDNRKLSLARTNSAHARWIQVVTGFVREMDVPGLEAVLKADFPTVTACVEDPLPEDNPPVNISLSPMVRPVQMLVDLFGRPAYNTFDPSPFIMPTFLLFFGICFGDVAYGGMLLLLSLYIMHKTKPYAGVYNFARLMFYAGITTIIFGFLLGSWFGDLYAEKYLGENNLMYRIMMTTQVIDPIQKPIVVLMAALAIGMFNQFYGIALKMYSAILRGNKAEALCDGLLWLVILPGFVVMIAKMFAPVPAPVFYLGLALFFAGALGLVLTQGRESSGLAGKLITGVISLYGIVGSYGLTAFIGDTMSYCRLLALSLTTAIVALSFNMMADLLRPIPYVGIFLFIFVLIIAHIFNFLISVLGAFVHSMRLIFVEFFGRFYETGSRPFAPLGFDSKSAILHRQQ